MSGKQVDAEPSAMAHSSSAPDGLPPEGWSIHGQMTNVTQWHPSFSAPYTGPNSLDPRRRNAETTDVTLFLGGRLWQGVELYLNPEYDQGFGLGNTLGMAGFPSGEAYKIGANTPYLRLPRAFIRQVIGLGGEQQKVEPGANQLAGSQPVENVTITLGKFSPVDIFDTNAYAHDPRADFLNWAIVDAGAYDYAADAWGFTKGGAVEWTQSWWTLRGGYFTLSTIPNTTTLDRNFKQYEWVGEVEARHQFLARPGKVKLLGYVNRGYMGGYADAVRLARQTNSTPDMARVRSFASRPGYALNVEQELAADLGFFARASVNDGGKEAFEFTEINRSLSAGLSLKGDRWGRHDDTVGLAVVVNALSSEARDYFAAGGMGILIGDGGLNYGSEKIAELYYSWRVEKRLTLGADYQYVVNPAYNRDRGPVPILGLRLHAEF
ncbi:MAG: carbohydrate porin [Rhodocyclaceae bacterium]|nr:carbohydrate porin [Rhodocyclaceae bacterium]